MYDSAKLKDMLLEALQFFDRYCKENHLEYAIAFGTELGCVRHGGFFPRDDDADVDMPIEDYLRLRKIWKKHPDAGYFLQTKGNELCKPTLFYQLRKNGTTWIDPGAENVPMHWGIAIIDIFPVYHLPKNKFFRKMLKRVYGKAGFFCAYPWHHRNASRLKKELSRMACLLLLNGAWVISALSKNSDELFYPQNRSELKKSIFYPAKPVLFEGVSLMGHADADQYLTKRYGDYMTPPPENERGGHPSGIIDLDNDYTKYTKSARK